MRLCWPALLPGAHILSGNVFEPRALDELLPTWKEMPACPIKQAVTKDRVSLLASARHRLPLPAVGPLHNKGNYVISLR